MKEHRLRVFRVSALELIESLEALVRLSRWNDADPKPAPLLASSAKLVERLGAASRLASARFHGTAAEVERVDTIRQLLRRLDVAYVAYRQQSESVDRTDDRAAASDGVAALETELAAATAEVSSWG